MKQMRFGKTCVIKGLVSIFLVFSVLFMVSGCALTKEYVDLEYKGEENVQKVPGAEAVSVSVNVTDARSVKDKVSCKKNGYGMEMAAIISNKDIAVLVADAIKKELANRGFKLDAKHALVDVDITEFNNDFKMGFWSGQAVGEVTLNVQVKKNTGQILYAESMQGESNTPGIMLASGENAKAALDAALKDAVSKLVNSREFINTLLSAAQEP